MNRCKKIVKNDFNKRIKVTNKDGKILRKLVSVIFAVKNIRIKMRVRDHCHVTGEYGGSAHESCNLNF